MESILKAVGQKNLKGKRLRQHINPLRPDSGRREKINLNFYFHTSCGASKGFMKALKAFIKPFEAPQRSTKIKI